jgi:hypothetical protein
MSITTASCVDNIDNGTTASEEEQQAEDTRQEKAQKFWAVVSHLVDVDDYTDDYEDKTFEPTYGVSQGTDGTRYVFTNDAATAAERFADLVDRDDIDENTQTYTYDDPDVGKLVYTKGTGKELATVEVSIKQIPSLKKIVYVPGAYSNGNFRGKAYYRFGDVVKRPVLLYGGEIDYEYWICVRPSFGPEGKGDSHWVCVNVLPKENTWHFNSTSNEKHYFLPTYIGTNEEHMQNLAELLYAIYFPEKWEQNIAESRNGDGKLRIFHDFSPNRIGYHNMCFWTNVQEQWRDRNILKKAFNYDGDEQAFKEMLEGDGLRLLYKGYSWLKTISWYCTLYEAHFQNGTELKEKNMHKVSYDNPSANMQGFGMDCRRMGKNNDDKSLYEKYCQFFDNDGHYRWTIRHATGKELTTAFGYDKQQEIRGVDEVYRYYHDVNPVENLTQAGPEETPAEVDDNHLRVGYVIGRSGNFYKTYDIAENRGGGAKAMVVYKGGNKRVEKDKEWNGLAIALNDLENEEAYCEAGMDTVCTTKAITGEQMLLSLDGWAMTKKLKNHACNPNHRHPAAEAVWLLEKPEGCSEWFIPSTGQWSLAMEGLGFGGYTYIEEADQWLFPTIGKWPWNQANVNAVEAGLKTLYLTSTEGRLSDDNNGNEYIHCFRYTDEQGPAYVTKEKTEKTCIRPFIAFKYDNGEK